MPEAPLKVLYIAGMGRSGSTLLDRLLGSSPAITSVGELKYLWERGLLENQLCGCGIPFGACEFWQAVLRTALGEAYASRAEELNDLRRRVDRVRYLPAMLAQSTGWKHLWAGYAAGYQAYTQVLQRLLAGIVEVSGRPVILDSSKDPSPAYLLSTMENVELYVLHLVRDSRAVAYSWQRKKRRPEITEHEAYIPQPPVWRTSIDWALINSAVAPLSLRLGSRYRRLRYEALLNQPQAHVAEIIAWLGLPEAAAPHIDGRTIHLEANHSVSGNPMRFERGQIGLRLDTEWQTGMSAWRQLQAVSFNWWMMLGYGYSLSSKARGETK